MLAEELRQLALDCINLRCERNNVELKKAFGGTPKRLYDTLSSFSNQAGGGTILFGIDQDNNYEICGVYDAQALQTAVTEQAGQMEPIVRPLFTVAQLDGKTIVSAEISECDAFEKPCYYRGAGRTRGSFVRVGDADLPMTEYEIYSYEVYKRKIQDELRPVPEGIGANLNEARVNLFLSKIRVEKPNFANLSDADALTLCGLYKEGRPTLAGVMLFGLYPQANFSGFDITALVVPGYRMGHVADDGARFIDNKRIGGSLPEQLDGAMAFVQRNIKVRTIIDKNGKRADKTEYPIKAIREIILNALIHRDYSRHTESSPIRILFYTDRLEVENPGGLYGRATLDSLGKTGTDTRNPSIAAALEVLIDTENRFSGIPTIRYEMDAANLPAPVFESTRGAFRATLYNNNETRPTGSTDDMDVTERLLRFCAKPKNRAELAKELNLSSVSYMMARYINPLLANGRLKMTIPDKPKSRNQMYYSG
ncbi:MAG: putative DNA binding domain-containing protein [Clostridiales bacterium]|nr:putative DNA binding domain-containing protein [Clostridiales bacterium]